MITKHQDLDKIEHNEYRVDFNYLFTVDGIDFYFSKGMSYLRKFYPNETEDFLLFKSMQGFCKKDSEKISEWMLRREDMHLLRNDLFLKRILEYSLKKGTP